MNVIDIHKYLLENVNSEIDKAAQRLKFISAVDFIFVGFLCSLYVKSEDITIIKQSISTPWGAVIFYMSFIFFFLSFATSLYSNGRILLNLIFPSCFCKKTITNGVKRSKCRNESDFDKFLIDQIETKEKILSKLTFLKPISAFLCYLGASYVFAFGVFSSNFL